MANEVTSTPKVSAQMIAENDQLTPAQRSLKIQLLLASQVDGLYQSVAQVNRRMDKAESEAPIVPKQKDELETQRLRRVVKLLGGKESAAYKDRAIASKTFRAIMVEYRKKFGVHRYDDTAKQDYNRAIEFYKNWLPDYELHQAIKKANEA